MHHHTVDLQVDTLRRLLSGQRSRRQALLETLDLGVEGGDLTQWDIDEARDALERLLIPREDRLRRLLSSEHNLLRGIGDMHMHRPVHARLCSMRLEPVAVVAIGILGLGPIIISDGPFAGITIEPEPVLTTGSDLIATPSFITDDCVWDPYDGDITLMGHVLPQSVCTAAEGMPLDDLAQTMLTQGLDLIVESATTRDDPANTVIRLTMQQAVPLTG